MPLETRKLNESFQRWLKKQGVKNGRHTQSKQTRTKEVLVASRMMADAMPGEMSRKEEEYSHEQGLVDRAESSQCWREGRETARPESPLSAASVRDGIMMDDHECCEERPEVIQVILPAWPFLGLTIVLLGLFKSHVSEFSDACF